MEEIKEAIKQMQDMSSFLMDKTGDAPSSSNIAVVATITGLPEKRS
jgi:hypothetical protein